MSNAYQTSSSFAKYCALATTLVFGLMAVIKTAGQDVGTHSVLKPLPMVTEFADPGLIANQPAPSINNELPQAVRTKDLCPLKKPLVCVAEQDEIWLVSARQSHLCWSDLSRIKVSQLQNEAWQPSSLEALTSRHANEKSKTTVVYCHGNRANLDWAQSRGLQVYQSIFQDGHDHTQPSRPPIRFVIFAWKSEQEKIRIRPDYEIKSKRAPVVGKTFGKFLEQFDDSDMVLTGFSLGSQVILTGLTNCELGHHNLPGRYQVALVAPALAPSYVCSSSLERLPENRLIRRTEVVANDDDLAIKVAQKIAAKTCREWLPEFHKLACTSQFAINPIGLHVGEKDISRQHSTTNYYSSEKVRCIHNEMLDQVFAAQNLRPEATPIQEFELTPATPTLQIEEAFDGESVLIGPAELELKLELNPSR